MHKEPTDRRATQTVHVNLRMDQYERLKHYLLAQGYFRGGVTAFIQDAVEEHLTRVSKVPLTFEQSWRLHWQVSPDVLDKWRCYGAAIDTDRSGMMARHVGRFTITELQQHHDLSIWNERTFVLVEQQIAAHRNSGIRWNEQRALIPPVPKDMPMEDCVIGEAPPEAPQEPVASLNTSPFSPLENCFLGECPQGQACYEAGACCATEESTGQEEAS